MSLSGKSVLFFSPQFFGYQIEIKKKLEELGAKILWFDDRPSNSFLSKVFIRINKKLVNRSSTEYYENIITELKNRGLSFDYVLFISPESISRQSLQSLKLAFAESRFILYMWDSFKNKQALDLLNLFDDALSFDPEDCKKHSVRFRPLFYLDQYCSSGKEKDDYDFLFIGTAHSDRYFFVKNLIQHFDPKTRIKTFFYLSGKKLFFIKKIFDKNFRNVLYSDISFKPLTLNQNADLIKSSKAILDINHPKQIGLTMRSIETLGAQKKLITTNKDIINYDFYNEDLILIIDRKAPIIPDSFLKEKPSSTSPDLLHKYSLSGWIADIFNFTNDNA